jgi:hypothetical protein
VARDNCLIHPLNSIRFQAVVLLGLLLLLVAPAMATEQLSLLINGKAIHFDVPAGQRFNESNWGTGVQYDFAMTDKGWIPFVTASGFDDSNENMSYYAGGGTMRRFQLGGGYHVDVGGVAFVMTRKNFHDGDPFLGALPAMSIGGKRVSLNITYVPRVDPKALPLVFFQLKIPIGQ